MAGMTPEETAGYIRHHLALAGRTDTLFSDDAVTLIHNTSRGYPRAVNNLAVNPSSPRSPRKAIVDEKAARTASPSPRRLTTRHPADNTDTPTTKAPPGHPRRGFLTPNRHRQ